MSELLKVKNFNLTLVNEKKEYKVISNVDLSLRMGEIAGLIGESGSGKSMFWKGMLGLADKKQWKCSGEEWFEEIIRNPENEQAWTALRGRDIAVILQDPMNAFDQLFTIKYHFLETARAHGKIQKKQVLKKAIELMNQLYIRDPEKVLNMYPFQCSGGMLQRIMIAIALMMDARIIIADEPTTSVDITVQREIIAMLKELNEKHNTSILYISHDLEIIETLVHKVYVMYAGYIVEELMTEELTAGHSYHPYTKQLLKAKPSYSKEPLYDIPGNPPTLEERQSGCPFAPRCSMATDSCLYYDMENYVIGEEHKVRCLMWRNHL